MIIDLLSGLSRKITLFGLPCLGLCLVCGKKIGRLNSEIHHQAVIDNKVRGVCEQQAGWRRPNSKGVEMDSTSKCFLCSATAPNLSCPEPKCPVRACSQQHLALHLQPLASQVPGLQPSPPQPSGQPASQTPASTSSPACLPYTITFKPGVGRCLVSWKEDIILGRNLAGTLSSNSKCHRQYIKHEKNIDSYPGCFADYFARRTCPFWEPSCCWTQSSENGSDKPMTYNVPTTHNFCIDPNALRMKNNISRNPKWIHISPASTLHPANENSLWQLSLSVIIISCHYSSGAVRCA